MLDKKNTELNRNINLTAKLTEDEWAYSAQRFFERVTPLWFSWLSWIFATGGVAYLTDITGNSSLLMIERVSYFLLMMYFLYFFASIRIEPYYSWAFNLKSKRKKALAIIPPLILGLALTLYSQALITNVIQQIQAGS